MKPVALGILLSMALGDRIDEIPWMTSKAAFEKARDPQTARWVLVYKEWPR